MDSNIINTFALLVVAVAIVVAIMLLIKKIGTKRMDSRAAVKLDVVSKITLLPKKHIFVVKVQNKFLVLGVTDNTVSTLTELDNTQGYSDEDVTNEVINSINTEQTSTKPKQDTSFAAFIKSSLAKK